jgi:hypothetical protein
MRFIENLCPPALLYLLVTTIHVGLDSALGRFGTAAVKVVMALAGTVILDSLCGVELGIVSWAVVATPFLMVALASSICLGLGMDRMAHEKFEDLSADHLKYKDNKLGPLVENSEYQHPVSSLTIQ